jgi:capsular exopolysaccharide synthesis family protein
MELKELLRFLRRWIWLLILGAVIGGGAAYIISNSQPVLYQSSTRIMVNQPAESLVSELSSITDVELTETFRNMLMLEPILEAASEQVGFPISGGQISSNLIEGTTLLNITVQDNDPQRAALIANALVDSLIKHNEYLQSDRFKASEESLQTQIAVVEVQINELQVEEGMQTKLSTEEFAAKKKELEESILDLNSQVNNLEAEIAGLSDIPESSNPPPAVREVISDKQAEKVLLGFRLDVAREEYQQLVVDGANADLLTQKQEEILGLANQQATLVLEIDDLLQIAEPTRIDSETQGLLNDKLAELALLQLNLDLTKERYQQLVLSDGEIDNSSNAVMEGTSLALYQQIYASLMSDYEAVRLARLQSSPSIVQVDEATAGYPRGSNVTTNAMLGAMAGLFIMAGIAFLIEYLDDTLKTPEDIDALLGLPVIGYVTETEDLGYETDVSRESSGPFLSNHPRAPLGEAFRSLRSNLEFAGVDQPLKSILVTSAGPSEGKTTIATNLAAAFAQQQKRVIMLDCDLRRPALHKVFGISNHTGLSNIVLGQLEIQDCIYMFGVNLAVIPSGTLPSNPLEMLGSDRMTQFLSEVGEVSDVIIIDSPPSIVADAAVMSAKVDGTILVIQPGSTRADDAMAQVEQLHRAGARILGVVFNQIPHKQAGYYSWYNYMYSYYDYGYNSEEDFSVKDRRQSRWGFGPFFRRGTGNGEEIISGAEGEPSR